MGTAVADTATGTEQGTTETKQSETGQTPPGRRQLTLAVRLSTVLTAVAIVALLAATIVFGFLYFSARSTLADRDAAAAGNTHAEQVATDYAVGASTIDFHDVKGWIKRLQHGTSPQLSAKFESTAPQLEQILLPLQWTSKATPLSAVVTSESGGIYKVDAYLNMNSTSAQTPDGAQTTVTYSLTIDSNSGWTITDVGGLQNALAPK